MSEMQPNLELLIDRLIDGELSEEEYRQLLQTLDARPDGWRRCAMGFLESQALGMELPALRQPDPRSPLAARPAATRRSWAYLGMTLAACAASFLTAFGVAWVLESNRAAVPSVDRIVQSDPLSPLVESPGSLSVPVDLVDRNPYPSDAPLARYQMVVDGQNGQETVEMPVFAADDPRAQWLLDQSGPISPEVVRVLEQTGNRVRHQRNWIPMADDAGRSIYVPVDELRVTPVGNRSFQ